MEIMWDKKLKRDVEVHSFFNDGKVLTFNSKKADAQSGNGWEIVKISRLIPYPYAGTIHNLEGML